MRFPDRPVKDPTVAWALQTLSLGETFHALPKAGGLEDQDSFQMLLILRVMSIRAELAAWEEMKNAPGG